MLSLVLTVFLSGGAFAQFYPVGDLTGDQNVDLRDLDILARYWLNPNCLTSPCEAELDGSNGVNAVDLAIMAENWGLKGAHVVINEFMASNASKEPLEEGELLDEDDDSSDWIELYNPTDQTVNLNGWYLINNDGNEIKEWQFPAVELNPRPKTSEVFWGSVR
jgi:hypothetical protein